MYQRPAGAPAFARSSLDAEAGLGALLVLIAGDAADAAAAGNLAVDHNRQAAGGGDYAGQGGRGRPALVDASTKTRVERR